LRRELDLHRDRVTKQFEKIVFRKQGDVSSSAPRRRFAELWSTEATHAHWLEALRAEGFADPEPLAVALENFRDTAIQADRTSAQRLQQFIPNLLLLLKNTDQQTLVLQRMLTVAERVLRRSA
jgi:glutamine synthetase adenylyltransferase